jgi:hypothetical protein
MKTAYTYTVLRYVHDTTTGEFLNVGVALYAPEAFFLGALCRTTYGRLTKIFPGVDGETFKSLMRYVQSSFAAHGEKLRKELPLDGKAQTVMEAAHAVLPRDDSSLQWSEMGSGLADDPSLTLEKLYQRMVETYEQTPRQSGRTDDEVWKKYRRELEQRHILARLAPKTITSAARDDEVEFEHAWKNEHWHCVEALSFDLLEADSIQDKAHRWLGQMASVKDSPEPFKLYLLLGEPELENLKPAFTRAQNILNKIEVPKEFVREHESSEFAAHLEEEIKKHDAEQSI